MPPTNGIPMLQGWADQISPGLSKIADGIGSMVNPNYAVQQELKQRIAADPSILTKLADQEALNPGSVEKTFGKQASTLVKNTTPSFNAQRELYLRNAAKSGQTTADAQADPTVLGASALKESGGQTADEAATVKANATIVGEAAKTAPIKGGFDRAQLTAQFPLIAKRAEVDEATLTAEGKKAELASVNASKMLDANAKTDGIQITPIVQKMIRGETLTQEEENKVKILNDADSPAFKAILASAEKAHQLNVEAGWHHSSDALANRQLRTQAFSLAKDLGMAGSVDAVAAYISDPKAAQRARDVASGAYTPQTEMDRQLGQIETEQARNHAAKGATLKLKLNNDIFSKVALVPKTNDPTARAALENSINNDLSTLSQQTGAPHVSFQYSDKSYQKDDYGFYITGAHGDAQKIKDSEVHDIMFAPSTTQAGLNNLTNSSGNGNDPLHAWRGLSPSAVRMHLKQQYGRDPEALARAETNLRSAGVKF